MFVINVPGSSTQSKKISRWHNKVYWNLVICSAIFGLLTLYSIFVINEEAAPTFHLHLDDVLVVVNEMPRQDISEFEHPKGALLSGPNKAAQLEYDYKAHHNKARNDKVHDDKAYDDRVHDDKVHDDKAYDDRVHDDKVHDDKVHDDRVHDDKVHDDKAHDDRVHDDKAHDDKAYDDKAHDDKAHDDKAHDDKASTNRAVDVVAELAEPWLPGPVFLEQPHLYQVPGEGVVEPIPHHVLKQRLNAIRESMRLSWQRYKKCGWGDDKLDPDTCQGSTWFGLGLIIIDSLDTLFLMGLKEELREAYEFVAKVEYRKGAKNVNIFEITIRVLGAFLTMFNFTKNTMYLSKAVQLGDMLIDSGAFSTSSGVPLSDIDLPTGVSHRPTCSGCSKDSSLSEVTTIQLEFNELTRLTGNATYKVASDRAMETILNNLTPDHLPRIYVDVKTGSTSGTVTLGARGDSYYEYLLKQWIQTRNHKFKVEYLAAMQAIKEKLVFSSHRGLTYIAEILKSGKLRHKMDHLVCFLPGNLALGTLHGAPSWHLHLAEQLIRTCLEMYNTKSGLPPEIIKFDSSARLYISESDEFSLLRPETAESLFLLWRVTKKHKYRAWAWDIYSAIERSAKHPTNGYSSMDKINTDRPRRKGNLESFFLAETLKYLYLINMPDDVIPLKRYVFNTEAHPFPVRPEL